MAETFLNQILSLPAVGFALLSPDQRWVAFEWEKRHSSHRCFPGGCEWLDSTPGADEHTRSDNPGALDPRFPVGDYSGGSGWR